jgi:RNA polymerase sigma-70 factor (ECF subfamily)
MAELSREDQELYRQIARGDEAAFRELYVRYQGPIYRFALHMSGNSATAEEVTQEAFMHLITSPKSYQPDKGTLAGYLFGTARNLTRRSMLRSQMNVPIADDADEGGSLAFASDLDILQDLTQAETVEGLRNAVLALPDLYREAVVLCDLEEMSYAAAAEALQCSEGTVASRLHRARAILKTKILKTKLLKTKLSVQKCAK